jgi:hypothetical protein
MFEQRQGADGPAAPSGEVERRLWRLSSLCAVPAAAALVAVGGIAWKASTDAVDGWLGSPPSASFFLTTAALFMVVLTSAMRGRMMARPPSAPDGDVAPGDAREADGVGRAAAPAGTAERWREPWSRYSRYTVATFVMLSLAIAAGASVGLVGHAPFYGVVLCLASLLAMVARWPRASVFEAILEGEEAADADDADQAAAEEDADEAAAGDDPGAGGETR